MDNFLAACEQLMAGSSFDKVSAKIKDVKRNHESKEQAAVKPEVFLHPMCKWHLYSKFEKGVNVTSLQLRAKCIKVSVSLSACLNIQKVTYQTAYENLLKNYY